MISDSESEENLRAQILRLEDELNEFQLSSKELEEELERELEESDRKIGEVLSELEKTRTEARNWRTKYEVLQAETNLHHETLQSRIAMLEAELHRTSSRLRDTEITNDTIEQKERVASATLYDLEAKYNDAVEKCILLESEIILKNELLAKESGNVQRLKDENRGLQDELDSRNRALLDMERRIEQIQNRNRKDPHIQSDGAGITTKAKANSQQRPRSVSASTGGTRDTRVHNLSVSKQDSLNALKDILRSVKELERQSRSRSRSRSFSRSRSCSTGHARSRSQSSDTPVLTVQPQNSHIESKAPLSPIPASPLPQTTESFKNRAATVIQLDQKNQFVLRKGQPKPKNDVTLPRIQSSTDSDMFDDTSHTQVGYSRKQQK